MEIVLVCVFSFRPRPHRSPSTFGRNAPLFKRFRDWELFLVKHVGTEIPGPTGGIFVSASQAIAPYLPFLRRYARALTGNQASGDAYVAAALEALIEDPAVLEGPASPRVALYRLFTKIWNSV